MANTKISQLPSYTGTAADLRWFVMNNSGETETYKYSGYSSQLVPGTGTDSYRTPNATAGNTSSIALGNTAVCNGNLSIAIGNNAQANGVLSMAIGYNTTANSGNGQLCIGWDSNAGDSSVIVGGSNNGPGQESSIAGYNNDVTVNKSTIVGTINTITGGEHQNILGSYNSQISSSGWYNNIFGGANNTITGTTSGATLLGMTNYSPTRSDATFAMAYVMTNYASYNFADDTAAAAGGVVLGQMYHNNGAMRIRIV
jgi:Head domain of trimeric autotransporter adhesin